MSSSTTPEQSAALDRKKAPAADAQLAADEGASSGEESGSDGEQDTPGDGEAVLQPGGTLTSKQKKKKKSKAAAKLRKRLGVGRKEDSAKKEESAVSEEVVQHVQQAVRQEHGSAAAERVTKDNLAKVMAMMNLERDAMVKSQDSKQKSQKAIADHKFWKTQPVVKPGEGPVLEEGVIEPNKPPSEVRQEPYPLPKDFEWVTIDIDDPKQIKEVYDLLSANYVEDDDATLRFNYSPEFLHWVLKHPGYRKTWHIGVRVSSSKKLVAFISGIPHELRVRGQSFHSTEINFLCVHKKLRSKRLAPVLIKEVTRQCNLTGVFQAIYTAGVVLPTPVSCARYYHRSMNPQKLIDIGFSAVPKDMPLARFIKRFEVPKQTTTPGLREMVPADVPAVGRLMRRYMRRFDMAPRFTDKEVSHLMLSGRGTEENGKRVGQVTWTYVVEDPTTHAITDMFSFYSLPSSILNNPKHSVLNAAYLFYYATDTAFDDSPSFQRGSSSGRSGSASSSASTSGAAASASAEGLEEWQTSGITGLNEQELRDEEGVVTWDEESDEVKSRIKQRLNKLMEDLLILARDNDFDVVNCLTVMDNQLFLQNQKFGPGDGFLRFYLFNWRVQPVAGGMGNRPGELEMDPVVQHIKATTSAMSGKMTTEDVRQHMSRMPKADRGSGNGIVMV